ncbi:MAG: hypothetical protein WCX28_14395 [Bacteriovoracaceae bacterium]
MNIQSLHKEELSQSVDFSSIGDELGEDLEKSLACGLKHDAVFLEGKNPLAIFRTAIANAIGNIQNDGRANLFVRLLKLGPYEEGIAEIPPELVGTRLTIEETTSVVSYLSGHMIKSFQGAVMEMLAIEPCIDILNILRRDKKISSNAIPYIGDSVLAPKVTSSNFSKSADLHVLSFNKKKVKVHALVEIKSYRVSAEKLRVQHTKHLKRVKKGLQINGIPYTREAIEKTANSEMVFITVISDNWKLPRTFRFQENRSLIVDEGVPNKKLNTIEKISANEYRVTIRWSHEALASLAYGMTFWFMGKVGEVLFQNNLPKEWSDMTPEEAGRNAMKMMLYYALRPYEQKENDGEQLTRKEKLAKQRAIALYNTFGFGYALGMNYRNKERTREMLWPKDLDEILNKGETENGCTIK